MTTPPPLPESYSSETIWPDGERMVINIRDVLQRLDIYDNAGLSKITIQRPDKGVQWSLFPETGTYIESVFQPPQEFNDAWLKNLEDKEWVEDGTEIISDRKYSKWIGLHRLPLLKHADRTVCYVDSQTGLRRCEKRYDKNHNLVATIDYSPVPPVASLFELPAGYRKDARRASQ